MELSSSKDPTTANHTENRALSFKWRLRRIHSSLRSSLHSKKRASSTSSSKGTPEQDHSDNAECEVKRPVSGCQISQQFAHSNPFKIASLKSRRKYIAQNKQCLPDSKGNKQDLSTVNGNLLSEKTTFDGGSLHKLKPDDRKLWSNNKVICNANVVSFHEQLTDKRRTDDQITGESAKRERQKSTHTKDNNNKERSIVRAKSLNKLASLFKRSSNFDKEKYERGKKLPSANSEASLSNTLSSTTSANLEALRIGSSSSTLDSLSDSDLYLAKDFKYRSLKRSRASLVYPHCMQRTVSLDNSLAPLDAGMGEKSRTVAEITPSIRVEEFVDNSLRHSSSVELHHGSSSSSMSMVDVIHGKSSTTHVQFEEICKSNVPRFTGHTVCSSSHERTKQKCNLYPGYNSINAGLGDFGVTSESASQTDFVYESNGSDCTMEGSNSSLDKLSRTSVASSLKGLPSSMGVKGNLCVCKSSPCSEGANVRQGYCERYKCILRDNTTWHKLGRKPEPINAQPDGFINHDGSTLSCKEITADGYREEKIHCVDNSERVYSKCHLHAEQTVFNSSPSDLHCNISYMQQQDQGQLQRCSCDDCHLDVCGENSCDVSVNCIKGGNSVPIAMETDNRCFLNTHSVNSPNCTCNTSAEQFDEEDMNACERSEESHLLNSCTNGRDGICYCCGHYALESELENLTPLQLLSSSPRTPISSSTTLEVLPLRHRSSSAYTVKAVSHLRTSFLEENRSSSCTHLNRRGSSASTSPPQVRPRIQSLEELSADATQVIMRKKRNFIEKAKLQHATSLDLPNILTDRFSASKRHSYGGACDTLTLPFSFQRSLSTEGHLDDSTDSMLSIDTPDTSTFNSSMFSSILSLPSSAFGFDPFDVSLGRSRSVPGFFGVSDIPQTSPIPEERERLASQGSLQSSVSSVGFATYPIPLGDGSGLKDYEMDAPEAFAEALWDHVTMDNEELSFKAGDIITVISMTSCDWWYGQVHDRVGWFPAPFVRVRVSQTLAGEEIKLAPPVRTRKGTNEGFLSDDDVRSRVVDEILNTERDYVKNLQDVVEGYLQQARVQTHMFTDQQITAIFSNIEQLYAFHKQLLEQLEEGYVMHDSKASLIGSVFLTNKESFDIYSEYCNNHPYAIVELKTLCESDQYKHFFEACRLLREMISISLDGFLLTPVQKICKYPLQLAELLKHTEPSHKDYQSVKEALQTMKEVASLINERKRKVECVNKIAKWQSTIEGWEGENVLIRSSELIHSGDVVKISKGTSQDRVMFLFDHQLIYCKKDLLKKNNLTYKGRIDTDLCRVTSLKDGEESHNGSPLVNAWKIYEPVNNRFYVMHTKKPEQQEKWMKAFTEEKRRVKEDARTGLVISQKTRLAAMRAVQCSIKNKKINLRKDKIQKSQSSGEIHAPPSPTLRLPAAVSSADLKVENELVGQNKENGGLLQRGGVIRRSFGLRGSKRNKEKRMSSIF